MTNILNSINELNTMVLQGKIMEAFDFFYHEEVIMQENNEPPTIGKTLNRKREEEFINNLIDFRSAKVLNVITGAESSVVIWQYDYTHKDWGIRNYTQASIQSWKDGKIIHEKFIY